MPLCKTVGIDPVRIGGVGGSSGGHLTLINGLRNSLSDPDASAPVHSESSKVQALVPWPPHIDRILHNGRYGHGTLALLVGTRVMAREPKTRRSRSSTRNSWRRRCDGRV